MIPKLYPSMDEYAWVNKKLSTVLADAQRQRDKRLDWILFEQRAMLDAVNLERSVRCLPPIALETIQRVERMAVGHSDYSFKFVLYCTELALGIPAATAVDLP